MPTYLYYCSACEKEFEEVHSINATLEECPHCKSQDSEHKPPKRLISKGSGFILNGSGWAKDNYS